MYVKAFAWGGCVLDCAADCWVCLTDLGIQRFWSADKRLRYKVNKPLLCAQSIRPVERIVEQLSLIQSLETWVLSVNQARMGEPITLRTFITIYEVVFDYNGLPVQGRKLLGLALPISKTRPILPE